MTRTSKIKAEENFPISEQGYMVGKLLKSWNVTYFRHEGKQIIYV